MTSASLGNIFPNADRSVIIEPQMDQQLKLKDKICRTCFSFTESTTYTPLNISSFSDPVMTIISTYLPQLNLQLTSDPVLCKKCLSKLEEFYNFLMRCLEMENKLATYCSHHKISPPVNLHIIIEEIIKEENTDIDEVQGKDQQITPEFSSVKSEYGSENDVVSLGGNLDEDLNLEDLTDVIKIESEKVIKKRGRRKKGEAKLSASSKKHRKVKIKKEGPFSQDLVSGSYQCDSCNKVFSSKWALDRHTPSHDTKTVFTCNECNMKFRFKHSFHKHLMIHFSNAPLNKPFHCDTCGKYFNRRSKLKRHQETHNRKPRDFGCSICGKRFITEEQVNEHKFRVHDSEKPFSCDICGNKYSSKPGLDVHMKSHCPDNPKPEPDLMCDFCGKLFLRKYGLEKHRMSHTGEKPYSCDVCPMRFKERYHLTIHMRRHTGERPYSCTICASKFASKNRLAVHMRIHTGVRPFPCSMCDMAFTRKDHLIKHVRAIHTGERPFVCDICSKTFNRRDYLIKHKKIHSKYVS